jgi:hypothetical protein
VITDHLFGARRDARDGATQAASKGSPCTRQPANSSAESRCLATPETSRSADADLRTLNIIGNSLYRVRVPIPGSIQY